MCSAWIRFDIPGESFPFEVIECDKAIDHTGNHHNTEYQVTWNQ